MGEGGAQARCWVLRAQLRNSVGTPRREEPPVRR
jgi:hypothetical protein